MTTINSSMDFEIKQQIKEMISELSISWNQVFDSFLSNINLTNRQLEFMKAIIQNTDGNPTLNQAADAFRTTRQNAKQIALSLERRGFMQITKDDADKRNLRLKIINLDNNFWFDREKDDTKYLNSFFEPLQLNDLYDLYSMLVKLYNQSKKLKNNDDRVDG